MRVVIIIITTIFFSAIAFVAYCIDVPELYYNIGVAFEKGYIPPQSRTRAMKWYLKSAELNNDSAQFALGLHYVRDQDIQDYQKAFYYFKLSAQQSRQVDAQNNLALMYYKGLGTQQDYNEAFKWYKIAAENGHVDAQLLLAQMYYNGEGVPCDRIKALAWLITSADSGNAKAKDFLDKNGAKYCKEDFNEAKKLAEKYKADIHNVKI